jgi:protein SCO1
MNPLLFASRSCAIGLTLALGLVACKPAQTDSAASSDQAATSSHQRPSPFHAVDLTGASYASDFALTDHNGQPRTLKDYAGKTVVLFFGFLNCPDICPSAMAQWASVIEKLDPADKDKVQVLFATVDPARDKPDMLKAYVTSFNPSFVGLYGAEAQIQSVSRNFRVFVGKNLPDAKGNYSVDHTAASFVFDSAGRVRLYVRPEITADQARSDLRRLIKAPIT